MSNSKMLEGMLFSLICSFWKVPLIGVAANVYVDCLISLTIFIEDNQTGTETTKAQKIMLNGTT